MKTLLQRLLLVILMLVVFTVIVVMTVYLLGVDPCRHPHQPDLLGLFAGIFFACIQIFL
jgi:hypothetical protein